MANPEPDDFASKLRAEVEEMLAEEVKRGKRSVNSARRELGYPEVDNSAPRPFDWKSVIEQWRSDPLIRGELPEWQKWYIKHLYCGGKFELIATRKGAAMVCTCGGE